MNFVVDRQFLDFKKRCAMSMQGVDLTPLAYQEKECDDV